MNYRGFIVSKKILFDIIAIVLLAFFVNFARIKIIENRINDDYISILASHKGEKYRINNFPVMEQQYYYSCSIATICSLIKYSGKEITEDEFMEKNGIGLNMAGMSPEEFYKYLKPAVENFDIKMNVNIKDSDVLKLVINQLKNNIPVPLFYSTIDITNMTRFGTHYSNIIGIDIDKNEVEIANVYGYNEIISIEKLLNQLKHKDEIMKTDWIINIAKSMGIIKNNTIYILEKNNDVRPPIA
jgi:hypothetical protein